MPTININPNLFANLASSGSQITCQAPLANQAVQLSYAEFPAEPNEGDDVNLIPTGDWYADIVTGRITLPDPGPNGVDM